MSRHFAPILAATVMAAVPASAQTAPQAEIIRIAPGEALANIAHLKAGTRDYLRFMKLPDGGTKLVAHERSIVSLTGEGDAARWQIRHEGKGPDISYGFSTKVKPGTLQPETHERWRDWNGDKAKESFTFTPTRVTGTYMAKEGMKALDVETPGGTYNFEIDMETLALLPWAANRHIVIPFYHPGGGEPADYTFKVTGETNVMAGGSAIPAWTVTTDYNAPERGGATFWIAKDSGTVLRVEQPLPNGATFVKALILG